jgi:signal transduction histidine kinase
VAGSSKRRVGRSLPRGRLLELVLVAVTLTAVALASSTGRHHPMLLSYLFLPVGVEAVLYGWRKGLALAAGAVALVALPAGLPAIHSALEIDVREGLGTAGIALWGASLLTSSVVIGRVSDRGRSRSHLAGPEADPVLAVEQERARISHDIHDGLTQSVAAALMETEILQSMVADSRPEVIDEVRRLRVIMGSALQESRSMIGNLRPPPLDPREFPETLTRLFEEFEDRCDVRLRWSVETDFALHTYSMRICVYRVLQEALNNVEQHARATSVRVRVRESSGAVLLSVTDDGTGFDPSLLDSESESHYGVRGMKERVRHLGGLLDVISSPGGGATVRGFIPGRPRPLRRD